MPLTAPLPPTSRTSGRARPALPTGLLVLFALVGLGALATFLSIREEQQTVQLVDQRAADLASSRIRGGFASTLASFRGADALAVDGVVDEREFTAFADGVTGNSLFQAISFAEVVVESDRSAFERRTGLAIRDTDGEGGFEPSVVRSRSLVVAMVSPLRNSNRAVLGFDLASDPARMAAALTSERTGLPAMSSPIRTATQALPGVGILSAIRGPDGATIGFLASGLNIDDALERAGVDVDSYETFGLELDGELLTGERGGGAQQRFDLAGHRFTIRVHTGAGINPGLPLLIGAGTLALLAAVTAAARQDSRQRDRIAVGARRSRAINELGQALAAVTDANRVLDEVLDRGTRIMDASHVGIALRDPEHPSRLTLTVDRTFPPDVGRRDDIRMDAPHPFCECVRTGSEVVIRDRAALAQAFPRAVDDALAAGVAAAVWVPLVFGRDVCVGALGFTWPTPLSGADLEDCRVAAHTVAELTSRSLERAVTSMAVQSAADSLGQLARELAGSHDQLDVQAAVHSNAAHILGARTAELVLVGIGEQHTGAVVVERAIKNRAGVTIGHLVLDWPRPLVLGPAQSAVFDTLVEMIGQTLERTALTEQEHQVIVQLQRDLLPPPPSLAGLDVAVHSEPAMSVVGLGGDFYDVLPRDGDRLFVVIGDVTGHGSEAVAAMAELKAVIQHLLRSGSDLGAVCDEADQLLDRRGMYATAQIAEIDPRRHTVRLVNAGHPYPVLRRADGSADLLTGGHRPLLGLGSIAPTPRPPATTTHLAAGDTLLLYTDGLIERRTAAIDIGMQLLVDLVRTDGGAGSAAEIVDHVLHGSLARGNGDKTDDDVALLVVRLLA
ncbi:MAG: SpoIIE family protein phosphatase [Ilumatobacteraceae bacterium]